SRGSERAVHRLRAGIRVQTRGREPVRAVRRTIPHPRRQPAAAARHRPDPPRGLHCARPAHGRDRAEPGGGGGPHVCGAVRGRERGTAEMAILALPFAVLRTLDYSRAGFDALKDRTIQELGRGCNAKLMVQFASRYWRMPGPWGLSTGTTFADTGYQSSWEVSRAQ